MWCWDITWLAGPVRGLFYYLYIVIDLYSRKILGWEVYEREGADHASVLMRRAVNSALRCRKYCTRIMAVFKKPPR